MSSGMNSAAEGPVNGDTPPSEKTGENRSISERWDRLQHLFETAIALPPGEWPAFVEREVPDDPELRTELLELLKYDPGDHTSPLTHALGAALNITSRDRRRQLVGKVVANYRLKQVIGHGGTGTVYLGERADRQYSAQVAIKIVDGAAVYDTLGQRVRAERQILASLNHPNIARLLDAGEIDDGRPYLVMEYVHGQPLDRFCDDPKVRLDLRGRLELFIQICAAVQYAHQNLVVHRDLKPANILVTAGGDPKLLDFGVAKLLDAGSAGATLALTRLSDRLLTPEYASPEQILGRTVTTSSDVYGLGVVLYELLTGLRPYVVPAQATQLQLEGLICVSDPLRPSSAVRRVIDAGDSAAQSSLVDIANCRHLTPERLAHRLEGDLDAIVMRALRKEPNSRYGSVEQFAEDIRRFLNNEPVQARQGNWIYYSQRFARRNSLAVAAASVFILFLATFGIVMSVQRQHIAEERDRATAESERAERVSDFMLRVFTAADPFENNGEVLTASQLLDRAAGTIQSELNEQPEVRARLLEAIGRAYRRQSQPERAVTFLQESLRVRRQAGVAETAQTGQLFTELAIALRNAGRFAESDRAFQDALRIAQQSGSENPLVQSRLLVDLGRLEMFRSNVDAAQKHFSDALRITRQALGPRNQDVGEILLEMANILSWRDDLDGAEAAAREALSIYRELVHPQHPDSVMASIRLAGVLLLKGQTTEAGTLYEGAINMQRVLYGPNSSQVADSLDSLAQVRLAQNNLKDAEQLTRDAIAINKEARGDNFYMTGYLQTSLAQILSRQGRYAEAEAPLRAALDLYGRTLPPDHQYVAAAEYVLGEVLLATNQLSDAEAVLTASMNRWRRTDAPAWRAARSASALGEALYREGHIQDAEKYLLMGYRELSTENSADKTTRQKARDRVTRFYTERGEPDKLRQLLITMEPSTTTVRDTRNN
ncbi:serine/threonine protein kinase [Povalibacter uvarum]|uniref:Serine/threonine protein kinase n=2 Tax=Povalibacter uvarum TaxID=732238 RepID=A0A841HUT7_9GAMM|nr:serine/threonine protein kinase [Povalibacter uvarum]